jgi:teichuronic acid biosynthesis glycosyltransferase TuaC
VKFIIKMKVLIVCSKNSGRIAPFIVEQVDSLSKLGVDMEYFCIEGKGMGGYLKNRKSLMKKIRQYKPDLIHAHYGLSGLLANTQRHVPVITTYHGSDINIPRIFCLSRINMILSKHAIFVSEKHRQKSKLQHKFSVIPCGVDIDLFVPLDKIKAREVLGLDLTVKTILFAGAFSIPVKNPDLAKAANALLDNTMLIELKGYTREEVAVLLNAVDVLLMTSFTEGSPQIIKEALACNCPVVSVDVGDVSQVISDIPGCFISSYEPNDVAAKLQQAIDFGQRTEGRNRILELKLDLQSVAEKILAVYNKLVI